MLYRLSVTTRSLDPPLGSFSAPVLLSSLSGSSRIGPEAPSSFTAVQLEVLESLVCEISLPAYPESSLPWSFTGKHQGRTAGERTNYHKSFWPFKMPRMNQQINSCNQFFKKWTECVVFFRCVEGTRRPYHHDRYPDGPAVVHLRLREGLLPPAPPSSPRDARVPQKEARPHRVNR